MEKSRTTIKRSNDKKLSPAQAQKEREKNLSVDISNFLEPKSEDTNYQAPIMSEAEFKKLCADTKSKPPSPKVEQHLVKSFLTTNQLEALQKITSKLNQNKQRDDLIDGGDVLKLIFTIINESDILGGKLTETELVDELKSVMQTKSDSCIT